ncbi:MAG TPA: EamA family transporter [Dermatophilaceae bacterium]|nr:EamA family transporter [Dermatophilaceae bacterium]
MKPRDTALAILVAIVWGSNFVVIDTGLAEIPPLLFTAMRFILVAIPAVFLVRPPGIGWKNVVLIGVFMCVGQFSLVYLALDLGMPPGLTSLVLQAQVLLTVLLSTAVLGERPSRKQLLGVCVGAAGLMIVAVGRSAIAPILPLVLVLGAALSWSIGNVLARKVQARSGLSLVVWSGLVVPAPLLLLSLVVEGPDAIGEALGHLSGTAIASAMFTAYVSSLLGYGIWNTLLARHPVSRVTPFALLVPVAGLLAAWIVQGEVPTTIEAAGGGLLLAGVAITTLRGRSTAAATAPPATTATGLRTPLPESEDRQDTVSGQRTSL